MNSTCTLRLVQKGKYCILYARLMLLFKVMKMVRERERERKGTLCNFPFEFIVCSWVKNEEKVGGSKVVVTPPEKCSYSMDVYRVHRFNAFQFEVFLVPPFLSTSICCLFSGITKQIDLPSRQQKENEFNDECLFFLFFSRL